VVVGLGISRHLEVGIDTEQLAHGHFHVRQAGHPGLDLGWHIAWFPDVSPSARQEMPHRNGCSLRLDWRGSNQSSLLEIVISLDDFAQLVLGPFVPPVGVGVMAFDQLLEPRLDLLAGGAGAQIEGFERLELQRS
jgi:hypothetical protein